MNFDPSDEQRMIGDSFARILADRGYPEAQGNILSENLIGGAPELWQQLEELGLLGASWPEARGGSGFKVADIVFALIETGRHAAVEPIAGCAVLPGLVAGRTHSLPQAFQPDRDSAVAVADDIVVTEQAKDGSRLTGSFPVIVGGDSAQSFLVVLPLPHGGARSVLVAAASKGLTVERYRLVNGMGTADLHFDDVWVDAEQTADTDIDLTGWVSDVSAVLWAADALGAAFAIRDLTIDYLRTRHQFGRPLGTFQALQHKMVDIYHEIEHFQSLVHLAALRCDESDSPARQKAVSALKCYIGQRIRQVAATAIQLHGGIGVTEEYLVGRLVKRILVADMLSGTADDHAQRLARLIAQEARVERPQPTVRSPEVQSA